MELSKGLMKAESTEPLRCWEVSFWVGNSQQVETLDFPGRDFNRQVSGEKDFVPFETKEVASCVQNSDKLC